MAGETNTPNMNLVVPGVGVTSGPQYATDLNSSLNLIDQHNHSPGFGVLINPSGLSISADLTFQNNNLTTARSIRFMPQSSPISGASDLGCLYESGVDLYYNDGVGNQVRITQSGGVAGSPGSIANLTSPASASYVAANSTFVWQSAANTPANMDNGFIILRNNAANSKGLTLTPPAAMGANYTITLPTLPSVQSFMTIDNSGTIGAPWTVDGSTIVIASGTTVQVPTGGITATQIANKTVTAAQIANSTVTGHGTGPSSIIADLTITAANIANNTITASQIVNNTITATQIANNTISATQIVNSTITATQIAGKTITASQLANSTVTGHGTGPASIIDDATITGANIASNTVSKSNIVSTNAASSSGVSQTVTSTSFVDLSGSSVTITGCSGTQAVHVSLSPGGFGAGTYAQCTFTNGSSANVYIILLRDGGTIAQWAWFTPGTPVPFTPPTGYIDTPGSGNHTYKFQAKVDAGSLVINGVLTQVVEL